LSVRVVPLLPFPSLVRWVVVWYACQHRCMVEQGYHGVFLGDVRERDCCIWPRSIVNL
jgi:hypothetical protein